MQLNRTGWCFFVVFLIATPIGNAQESSAKALAASATHLNHLSDTSFISKGDFFVAISVTNAFGFSEHFVAGEVTVEPSGKKEKTAFFQSFIYDHEAKDECSVTRKKLNPTTDWNFLGSWIKNKGIYQSLNTLNQITAISGLDGYKLEITIRYEEIDLHFIIKNPGDYKSFEPLLKWILQTQKKFDFKFRFLALEYLDENPKPK